MVYDSKTDTLDHIQKVNSLLLEFCRLLTVRAEKHDYSKLHNPVEKEWLDVNTPKLRSSTYGSVEYESMAKEMRELHCSHNRHHPEFYDEGVEGMGLIDIVEMICDWKAAALRHADGDILKSIEINRKRFNLSPQLVKILLNSVSS